MHYFVAGIYASFRRIAISNNRKKSGFSCGSIGITYDIGFLGGFGGGGEGGGCCFCFCFLFCFLANMNQKRFRSFG